MFVRWNWAKEPNLICNHKWWKCLRENKQFKIISFRRLFLVNFFVFGCECYNYDYFPQPKKWIFFISVNIADNDVWKTHKPFFSLFEFTIHRAFKNISLKIVYLFKLSDASLAATDENKTMQSNMWIFKNSRNYDESPRQTSVRCIWVKHVAAKRKKINNRKNTNEMKWKEKTMNLHKMILKLLKLL